MTKPSIPGRWLPVDPAVQGRGGKQSLRGDPDLKPPREKHSFGAGGEPAEAGAETTLAQLARRVLGGRPAPKWRPHTR